MTHIKLADCQDGFLYRLNSRNLTIGIYHHDSKSFVGLRTKFKHQFIDTENHYDTGAPYGTAKPIEELENGSNNLTIDDYVRGTSDENLLAWLKEKQTQYQVKGQGFCRAQNTTKTNKQ
ncbi:hypothetical protein HOA92_06280 [archaeon]|jgi:hypothetical protein|nr:hypothetical protein [archaeon]MBT6762618.1 hypothetical protein [archaeon]